MSGSCCNRKPPPSSERAYSPSELQHEFRYKTPCNRNDEVVGRYIWIFAVYHTGDLFEHFISTTTKRILPTRHWSLKSTFLCLTFSIDVFIVSWVILTLNGDHNFPVSTKSNKNVAITEPESKADLESVTQWLPEGINQYASFLHTRIGLLLHHAVVKHQRMLGCIFLIDHHYM